MLGHDLDLFSNCTIKILWDEPCQDFKLNIIRIF